MQPRDGRAAYRPNWAHGNSFWMADSPADGPGVAGTGQSNVGLLENDGTLNAIVNESVRSMDVPVKNPNPSFQEDELLSWLQYPPDDPYEKGYCSDWYGELPNSNAQIVKHSFNQLGLKRQETSLTTYGSVFNGAIPPSPPVGEAAESCGSGPGQARSRVAGADAVMAEGGAHAGGPASHSEVEVLSKMRAPIQPSLSIANRSHSPSPSVNLKSLDLQPPTAQSLSVSSSSRQPSPLLPYATMPLPALKPLDPVAIFMPPPFSDKSTTRNFSHFSRPVAETKANLHMIGAGSGPTNIERVRQQFGQLGKPDIGPMDRSAAFLAANQITPFQVGEANNSEANPQWAAPPTSDAFCAMEGERVEGKSIHRGNDLNSSMPDRLEKDAEKGKGICRDNYFNSSIMSDSAVTASDKGVETETAEQTATSPSRGSGSSSEKSGREAAIFSKRKFIVRDDSEDQSGDIEDTNTNSRKPLAAAKRTRAAEMHNQSERRRRDKIKEKMKTLQDLIPNSHKTDKASILDEAIEYTKLLQSQLQTMSMRTGIGIPQTMLPSMAMQHLQVPVLPHMGLGLGMGMGMGVGLGMGVGMGMGLMDANAAVAAGRTMVPIAAFPGQPSIAPPAHAAVLAPTVPGAKAQERTQNPTMMDPYSLYLAHHQVQPTPLNVNMHRNLEMYNAYLRQQQQQQQWQFQMQQSQQQSQDKPGRKQAQ